MFANRLFSYGKAGLQDVLVEAEVISADAVVAALSGRHYNRAVRAHKIVWEALPRLRWRKFEKFLDAGQACGVDFAVLSQALSSLRLSPSRRSMSSVILTPDFKALMAAYEHFCQDDHGPLFSFWSSYLSMVELFLAFTQATRDADRLLHLACSTNATMDVCL